MVINKNMAPTSKRDKSLDFIKFIYILMMITYHCFYGADYNHSFQININKYLMYVSGSFPFMAGYFISDHYFKQLNQNLISNRLLIRGIKLISIYIILNLIYFILNEKLNLEITYQTENITKSILLGKPSEVVYDILYSIGIILVYGAALSAITRKYQLNHSTLTVLISSLALLITIYIDKSLLIASGLAGIIIGTPFIKDFLGRIYSRKTIIAASFLFGLFAAILIEHMRTEKAIYILGVITLFFSLKHSYPYIKKHIDKSELISLLSRHSLFIYLFHIPLIIITVKIFLNVFPSPNLVLLFITLQILVICSSILVTKIIETEIKSEGKLGAIYKLVFN